MLTETERTMLKHYQFPDLFIRRTKNAYISIVNEDILKIAKDTINAENYCSSLRKKISITNNFGMNMYYCRKVFATYLRSSGIESEIIDLLQGSISSSVFVNHYYRPVINEIIANRIRPVLFSLNKLLEAGRMKNPSVHASGIILGKGKDLKAIACFTSLLMFRKKRLTQALRYFNIKNTINYKYL